MAEEKTTVEQETADDTVLDEQTEQPTPEETDGEPEAAAADADAVSPEAAAEGGAEKAEGTAEAEQAQAAKGEKKSPFKKKEKKKDKRDERIEELTDQVKRQMAEFENFRRRTEKEKTQMYEVGAKSIIEKILPVVDNFERGLAAVPEEDVVFISTSYGSTGVPTMSPFTKQDFDEFQDTESR